MTFVAIALAAFVAQPAQAPAHGAHAGHAGHAAPATAPAARLSSATTSIGDLLANPASRAIVERHLPGLSSHPQLQQALRMTLRAAMPYSGGMVTNERLTAIDAELAALPAS
ncbi:MAG TPA: hypothetical protein VGB54_02075 [Allosphingosinicella sp.]|jgi:hypothetical protein